MPVAAQQHLKDSLENLLKSKLSNEARVNVLNELANQYYYFNDTIAFNYANEAMLLAQSTHYPKGIKYAHIMVGLGYYMKCELKEAIRNYRLSAQVKAAGTEADDAYNLLLMGNCYRLMDKYDSAISFFRKALTLRGNKPHIASLYKGIASVSSRLGKHKEAISLLDTASSYLKLSKASTHNVQLEIWNLYGQVYTGLLNYEQARYYYEKMCSDRSISQSRYHQIACKFGMADLANRRGNYAQTLQLGFEALELIKKYINPQQYADILILIGRTYEELSQYDVATDYLFKALKLVEPLSMKTTIATIYTELAWSKNGQRDFPSALEHANKSLDIYKIIGNMRGVANCHTIIGLIYLSQKKYSASIKEHELALPIYQQLDLRTDISACLFNISLVYDSLNQIDKALDYQLKSMALEENSEDKRSLAISYNSIASLLLKLGRWSEALSYAEKGNKVSLETGSWQMQFENALLFANYYQMKGNFKKAFEYERLSKRLNDSIYSETSATKSVEAEAIYNADKTQREIELLQQKQAAQASRLQVQQAELSRKNWILTSTSLSLFALMIAGFIGYRSYKEKTKANLLLHEQKEEIQTQAEELTEAAETIAYINQGLENQIEVRTSELKQAYKELDTFFYRSSHDFRRPVTTFLGLANVAKIAVKDVVALDLFERVTETASGLDKMLKKLQSISDVGSQEMLLQEVALKELIDEVIQNLHTAIQQKGIVANTEVHENIQMVSYPALLKIIIENIIENAVHFAGTSSPYFNVKARVSHNSVIIEVADNGQGIDEEYLSRIFEMYFRANEHSKGNGLGLYIAKKAVEKLNGKIHFITQLGAGSTFTVELPIRQ
jgi:signal transduction histidine kinase